jgi:hypothetical protein
MRVTQVGVKSVALDAGAFFVFESEQRAVSDYWIRRSVKNAPRPAVSPNDVARVAGHARCSSKETAPLARGAVPIRSTKLSRFVFGHVRPNGRVGLQYLDQVMEFLRRC